MKRGQARVFAPLGVSAALLLFTAACGGGAPTSPTIARPSSTISVSAPAAAVSAALVTNTWNCFVGGREGILAPSGCGGAIAIGAESVHQLAGTPSTPTGLQFTVTGSTVTLTWTFVSGANPNASSFVVEAGTSAGVSDITSFDTGSTLTSLTVQQVPLGAYFVRVRARSAEGRSDPSNEVVITVGPGGCATPQSPQNLAVVTDNGDSIVISWTATSGSPATYVLEVGSGSGLADFVNREIGTSLTATGSGLAFGTYYVRIRARNACGTSAPSNEQVIRVSGKLKIRGRIYGHVRQGGLNADAYLSPVAGALISTSLDGATTTTDVSGDFELHTNQPAGGFGCRPFTLTVTAAGYPTYSRFGPWGGGTPWKMGLTWDISDPIIEVGCSALNSRGRGDFK